jgi:hypothetical protein
MKQTNTKTARQELAYIERRLFKGAGLDKASRLKGEERRDYRLAQVNRLLAEKYGASSLAMHLSDWFWTADKGRVQYDENPTPLLSLKEQQTLTDREMNRLRLILEIAGLCHDLSLHFTFDLKDAFGLKNDTKGSDPFVSFWVSNKQLVEWLTTTPYEHIAMHTAYIMKKCAINAYACGFYLPAQDELAQLYSEKHKHRLGYPDDTEVPPRDYVSTILDSLLAIERHWQRGRQLKLRPDVVILHDEIYGVVPRQFDKSVLEAAQTLYDYMDAEVYGRLVDTDDQTVAEVLNRFAEKVREVRSKYILKWWIEDDSLEFSYLMDHAERCGNGFWREEDDAL